MTAMICVPGSPRAEPRPSSRPSETARSSSIPIYKQRNVVERMFCRFKDWRRVATRYDRNIKTFMATIAIAAAVIWWLN
jgi:transposase